MFGFALWLFACLEIIAWSFVPREETTVNCSSLWLKISLYPPVRCQWSLISHECWKRLVAQPSPTQWGLFGLDSNLVSRTQFFLCLSHLFTVLCRSCWLVIKHPFTPSLPPLTFYPTSLFFHLYLTVNHIHHCGLSVIKNGLPSDRYADHFSPIINLTVLFWPWSRLVHDSLNSCVSILMFACALSKESLFPSLIYIR